MCSRDDGGCKHVVALLLALLDFTERHKDRATLVGTDVTCKWDKPRKQSMPKRIQDIHFGRCSENPAPFLPKTHYFAPPSNNRDPVLEKKFKHSLEQYHPNAVALHLLSDSEHSSDTESEDETALPNMVDMYRQYSDLPVKPPLLEFLRGLCDEQYIQDVEMETRDQNSSSVWREQRKGRVTASVAHSVLHAKEDTLHNANSYIFSNVLQRSIFTSAATEYGLRSESIAQELYNNLYKEHHNFSFKKSGLVINDDYPFLGASPDGIAYCDCCGQRVVEIKCPYSLKEKSVEDICSERGYHLEMKDGQVSCRSSSPWYTQMQVQMYVTKSTLCHLAIYTQVPPFLHVIKVAFNEEWCKSQVPVLYQSFEKFIWPLLGD